MSTKKRIRLVRSIAGRRMKAQSDRTLETESDKDRVVTRLASVASSPARCDSARPKDRHRRSHAMRRLQTPIRLGRHHTDAPSTGSAMRTQAAERAEQDGQLSDRHGTTVDTEDGHRADERRAVLSARVQCIVEAATSGEELSRGLISGLCRQRRCRYTCRDRPKRMPHIDCSQVVRRHSPTERRLLRGPWASIGARARRLRRATGADDPRPRSTRHADEQLGGSARRAAGDAEALKAAQRASQHARRAAVSRSLQRRRARRRERAPAIRARHCSACRRSPRVAERRNSI